jgi:hypothetical protein
VVREWWLLLDFDEDEEWVDEFSEISGFVMNAYGLMMNVNSFWQILTEGTYLADTSTVKGRKWNNN